MSMKFPPVESRIAILKGHPWAGYLGKVVRHESDRTYVLLDSGHTTHVFSPKNLVEIKKD